MALTNYTSEPTPRTPHISFDPSSGNFEIKGKSVPENPIGFYSPVISWLEKYMESPASLTTIKVQLEYFNTSSSKYLVDILKKLDFIYKEKKGDVVINWLYEKYDDDMLETGEDFKNVIKTAPFNLVSFAGE